VKIQAPNNWILRCQFSSANRSATPPTLILRVKRPFSTSHLENRPDDVPDPVHLLRAGKLILALIATDQSLLSSDQAKWELQGEEYGNWL